MNDLPFFAALRVRRLADITNAFFPPKVQNEIEDLVLHNVKPTKPNRCQNTLIVTLHVPSHLSDLACPY